MKKPKPIRTLAQFFVADPKNYSPEPDVMPGPEQRGVEHLQDVLRTLNVKRLGKKSMRRADNFLACMYYVDILMSAKAITPTLGATIIDTVIMMRGRDQEVRRG